MELNEISLQDIRSYNKYKIYWTRKLNLGEIELSEYFDLLEEYKKPIKWN